MFLGCANCRIRLWAPWGCVLFLFVKRAYPSTRHMVAIQSKLTKSQTLRVDGTLEAIQNNPNWSTTCLSIKPVWDTPPMMRIDYFLKQAIPSLNSSARACQLLSCSDHFFVPAPLRVHALISMFLCAHLCTVNIFSAFLMLVWCVSNCITSLKIKWLS